MCRWLTAICLFLAVLTSSAQDDKASKANELFRAGKRIDALPLYEELTKVNPKEVVYAERYADCLGAKSAQTSDPVEVKAIRLQMKEAAKRAIELGDTAVFIQAMANLDPDAPVTSGVGGPAAEMMKEAEKAFTAGDFNTALAKYSVAADTDPRLYEAALFAGDTAYQLGNMKTAIHWFARAVSVDANRETAYRYWGDALLRLGHDPAAARPKFIDAIVAEPYSKFAWQGLKQWATVQKAIVQAPKIDRPEPPTQDPKDPKNIIINIDPKALDERVHPGASVWTAYSLVRADYRSEGFKKDLPDEKEYRHTLKEEQSALSVVITTLLEKKTKPEMLDESLRNLLEVNKAGMLDCWILVSASDEGIARDYEAYRADHRELLHAYIDRFVIHGGDVVASPKQSR